MIIRGPKVAGHYWLRCIFAYAQQQIFTPIEMLVDTGATTTTIFSEIVGIDCTNLKKGQTVTTANGPRSPYVINDALLLFRTSKKKLYPLELKQIDVLDIQNPQLHGLAGMDVLSNFKKISLSKRYITLQL